MSSGRKTLADIERGIADLRGQESDLQRALEADNEMRIAALEERTRAFRALAELRTRAAVADGVIDRADRLESKVERILEARQKTIETLKARDAEADGRRDELNREAGSLRLEIDGLETRLDEVGARARAELAGDAAFVKLEADRDGLSAKLERAREKTERAEADRREKGKAYENDPLFMYLWNRKYGSKDYRPGAFVRFADDWVARLVRYQDARANYAILNEIPERLTEHCAQLENQFGEAQADVDAALAKRIAQLAGSDLTGDLRTARARQDDLNAQLEKTEAEIGDISVQLNRYAEGLDDPFREAVRVSAEFLEKDSYLELLTLARSTIEPDDDEIVRRIGELDREADRLGRSIESRRRDLDRLAKRRQEMMEVAANFRRKRYDDEASFFEPDDLAEDLLKMLLKGGISAAEYWLRSQGYHGRRRRSADPFRRSGGFPPFGFPGGGGSRRGGGGGGRFRTGGGF